MIRSGLMNPRTGGLVPCTAFNRVLPLRRDRCLRPNGAHASAAGLAARQQTASGGDPAKVPRLNHLTAVESLHARRLDYFYHDEEPHRCSDEAGVCSCRPKSFTTPGSRSATARSLGSLSTILGAGSKAYHFRHVFRTTANLTPARLSC